MSRGFFVFAVLCCMSLVVLGQTLPYQDATVINRGLSYLVMSQNPDGSWTQTGDDYRAASVTTARAAEALLRWNNRGFGDFSEPVSRALGWLARQDTGQRAVPFRSEDGISLQPGHGRRSRCGVVRRPDANDDSAHRRRDPLYISAAMV
ncbi:MAG TPA: hypothetical protein PLV45_14665 [bacterium]|nr:hypothetical protein [bacterium]